MLQLYDISHNKLCALTDDKLKDYYLEQAVNILDHLYFLYPILDANFTLMQEEGFVCTQDNEYVIKEINLQGSDTGIEYAQIVADVNIEDIQGTRVDNFDTEEQLCTDAANLALAGTGWSVGTCDVTALRTTKKTQCTSYDVLQEIQKTYNCEMTYDAVNKKVGIYQQGGTDKGAYFSEQLNLKQLSAQGSSRDYITCLIPIGKDGLDITSVNPTGLDYIVNHQYSSKNIYAYWSDNNYTVAQDFYDDAVKRLTYMSMPVIAYSVAIIDLANVSGVYSSLDYDLGDSITLLSASKSIRIQERIVKISRYPLEPERSTCEIANRIASLDALNVRFDDTSDTVDNVTTSDGMVDGSMVECLPNSNLGIVTAQNLTSVLATIGTAIITKLDVTGLTAINASITSLTANKANIADLTAAIGRIGTLEVHSESVDTLLAGNITATNIKAGTITAASGIIANLAIGTAQIQLGAITTALIATAAIGTVQIADGSITDAKIVGLTANKITAGTINAGVITVTNLNCANLTVGTINGAQITPGAIGATQLATAINTAISTAQSTANGKNTVYYGSTAPTSPVTNDLWMKPVTGGIQPQIWNGTAWISATDVVANTAATNVATAQTAANNAQTSANGKNKASYGATQPASPVTGDLWFNPVTGGVTPEQWNGTAWVSITDTVANAGVTNAATAQTTANTANTAAGNAQTTASGKNTAFYQSTTPTAKAVNDLWFNTANGYQLSVWSGSAWVLSQLGNLAIAAVDAGKITTGSLAAARIAAGTITGSMIAGTTVTAANLVAGTLTSASGVFGTIDAGILTTGTLAAARIAAGTITGTMIAGTTIKAANIFGGTITATQIAAGTITSASGVIGALDAGAITTGTLAAARIAAGSLNASVLTANTITATQIASGIITSTQIQSRTITADRIVAGAITANEIMAATITGDRLVANTITAAQIATTGLNASAITTGTLSAARIDVTTLSAAKIICPTDINTYVTIDVGGILNVHNVNFPTGSSVSIQSNTAYSGAVIKSNGGSGTINLFTSIVNSGDGSTSTAQITNFGSSIDLAVTNTIGSASTDVAIYSTGVTITGDLNITGKLVVSSQPAWIAPTLLNSWVNYGSTYANAGYFKDSLGFVHLHGLIKSGTLATAAFNLPVGYRPLSDIITVTSSNHAFGDLYVRANGDVIPNTGTNVNFSLGNISFRAEQ